MKDFLKMTFATLVGLMLFTVVSTVFSFILLGAIAAIGSTQTKIANEGVLKIDMSTFVLTEQTQEADPFAMLTSGEEAPAQVGIWDAIKAINTAAEDPAVKFIYLLPDFAQGGTAHIEEFRTALANFRNSGKAVISYIESPTNAGYYLASVSDKIYMTPYTGFINQLQGTSAQMIFLKDALDRLGINVQLIRHGKYKSAGEMFVRNSSSKENLEQNEAMVKSIWNSWTGTISEAREIPIEKFNALLNDLTLKSSEDFVTAGLADELLSSEELKGKLASLYGTESSDDIKNIPFTDYVTAKKALPSLSDKKIAVIYADGDIIDGKSKDQVAGDRFSGIIAKIRKDPAVKAVVLRVNSPGGSVLASEKIKNELDLLRESVPVVASYGDYAASGGYWISANADYIFSNATTLTGSIGVFSMIPDLSGTVKDKLHVNITSVNSNEHSDMYSLMRPLDKAETAYFQSFVETVYEKFTGLVAEGREMTVPAVDEIAQGRVWTGAEGLEIGLVDQIGTIEDALEYAAGLIDGATGLADVQVEAYPKPLTLAESLLETLNGPTEVFAGTPLEDIEAAFRNWSEADKGKVYARMPYEISIR
mgnify:CR=1 FL=1